MSLDHAAHDLLAQLHALRGMVNVLPVTDSDGEHLVVWVDDQYMRVLKLPTSFGGYPVTVVLRPRATASYRY